MANPLAPGGQWAEDGNAVSSQITRVYLVQNGTDALTTGPKFVLDDAGPSTAAFVYNEGTGKIQIDSDPAVVGALKIAIDSNRKLIFYT